ncbi:MAG TPA: hypothetical protein VF553_00780 [Pyrinomonadaceae bacterium]
MIKADAGVLLQPAQAVVVSKGVGQERATEMRALEDGKPIEREMRSGESHSYKIALARSGDWLARLI